jgi:hypothetical protein
LKSDGFSVNIWKYIKAGWELFLFAKRRAGLVELPIEE